MPKHTFKIPQGCHLFSVSENHKVVTVKQVSRANKEVLLDIYRVNDRYTIYIHDTNLKDEAKAVIQCRDIDDLNTNLFFLRNMVFPIYKDGDILTVQDRIAIFLKVVDEVETFLNAQ